MLPKKVKFVATDEGEFAFVITNDDELTIKDVEIGTEKTYSAETVGELLDFLNRYWAE